MTRTIEVSGSSIVYLFYAVSLAIVPVLVYFVVWPLDDFTSGLVGVLLVALVLVAAADLWYWKSGEANDHLAAAANRTVPYDITYDPVADPGHRAKHDWMKAVRRFSSGDDEDE